MASCDHIFGNVQNIIREIIKLNESLENELYRRTNAAVTLQSAWRGRTTRLALRHLHHAAIIIQRWTRGYLVRNNLPNILIDCIYQKYTAFYDAAVTKIQALWRGYSYRKKNHFHALYHTRIQVQKNNLDLKHNMQGNLEGMGVKDKKKNLYEMEAKNMVLNIIFKLHHQLRTYSSEGIYSIHNSQKLSKIEQLLASVKHLEYMKHMRKKYTGTKKNIRYFKVPSLISKEEFIRHNKAFSFDTRIIKKYETILNHNEPFQKQIKEIERFTDWSKHIHYKDFDVTAKKKIKKYEPSTFYENFWSTGCDIHDIEDKF